MASVLAINGSSSLPVFKGRTFEDVLEEEKLPVNYVKRTWLVRLTNEKLAEYGHDSIITRVQSTVARLRGVDALGKSLRGSKIPLIRSGSACAIGSSTLVTARHVVQGLQDLGANEFFVDFPVFNNYLPKGLKVNNSEDVKTNEIDDKVDVYSLPVKVDFVSELGEKDFAVVSLNSSESCELPFVEVKSSTFRLGENLVIIGHGSGYKHNFMSIAPVYESCQVTNFDTTRTVDGENLVVFGNSITSGNEIEKGMSGGYCGNTIGEVGGVLHGTGPFNAQSICSTFKVDS